MSGPVAVTTQNLRKVFATRHTTVEALAEVSIEIEAGQFLAVVGPSGCGKSTLLMMVAGLIPPSDGEVRIDGELVQRPYTRAGIVFQRDVLLQWRTVWQNVLLPAEIKRLARREQETRAGDLLHRVGLAGFEDRYPHELSGGMRQRVAIVRALVQDPPLLLMDEPFGALDALTREQMCLDLSRLVERGTQTTIFITHSIEEAVFLADRVAVFSPRPGRILRTIEINLERPRTGALRSRPEFMHYVQEIRTLFAVEGILSETA